MKRAKLFLAATTQLEGLKPLKHRVYTKWSNQQQLSMPNVSHNLEPRFDDDIDAEVIGFEIKTVGDSGYVNIGNEHSHQLLAWVPLKESGQLKTTSYNQIESKRTQTYAQEDGGVNIGTEEWTGERILLLVLDEKITED